MNTATLPAAWLGRADGFGSELVIRICMKCPDKAEAEAMAAAAGAGMSHGLCPACFEKTMREISEQTGAPIPFPLR